MPVQTPTPTRKAEYTRPWLAPYQLDAIFHNERYGVVEASTKSGKTVSSMAWIIEQALKGRENWNYWWVAPIRDQSKIAYQRIRAGLPRWTYRVNESELKITLANGAHIWFKGADHPDSLYGEDVYGAVIDEASRVKEMAWHAVRSTLTATQGPIRLIGNVKGKKNWFYHLARRFESGDPGGHYARITAWDAVKAGVLDQAEVEDAQRIYPEGAFRELYLAEPTDDGSNPFGIEAIRACVAEVSPDDPLHWGWDLGRKVDWTVGTGLDRDGHTAAFYRNQLPWEEQFELITRVTTKYASIDATGLGDPMVQRVQRARPGVFSEYVFSPRSKQQLMEGLGFAISAGEITYPEGPIVDELEEFQFEYSRQGVRYSAPEGLHDDCVMSLALAVHCRQAHVRRGLKVGAIG